MIEDVMGESINDEMELFEIPLEKIVGDRVVLRPLEDSDALSLFEIIDESRDFLSEHLPWPGECNSVSYVSAKIEAWSMQLQMANGGCWGIFEKTSEGEVVAGCIMLGWVQWTHRSASVSYWLGRRFCGRGLATEALLLLAGETFAMGLNRLELSASVKNPKSAAVALRAGFREEGICREYERIHGQYEDHIRFALLARDFC